MAEAGAAEVVVAALRRFGGEDAEVAEQGCAALMNLAGNNADNRKAIASAGGVEVVVSALRAHGEGHAGVADQGCWALCNLCWDTTANAAAIATAVSAGAVALVEAAVRAHPSSSKVQKWGSKVLTRLNSSSKQQQQVALAFALAFAFAFAVYSNYIW